MEKREVEKIERNRFKLSQEESEKENQAVYESMREIYRIIFDKDVSVEIIKDAIGNKTALIKRNGQLIHSTDIQREVSYCELFLKDPEAAAKKLREDIEISKAEQEILNEIGGTNDNIKDDLKE